MVYIPNLAFVGHNILLYLSSHTMKSTSEYILENLAKVVYITHHHIYI